MKQQINSYKTRETHVFRPAAGIIQLEVTKNEDNTSTVIVQRRNTVGDPEELGQFTVGTPVLGQLGEMLIEVGKTLLD